MANATLRRHLAALLDCGIILRRDSPNGKRYARKGRGGELEDAFGFSLAPLLARAEEFHQAAERVRADGRALKLMRERITLQRRDIAKLIEAAIEEGAPGAWQALWRRFRPWWWTNFRGKRASSTGAVRGGARSPSVTKSISH
jgi:replication initiation protein RepC